MRALSDHRRKRIRDLKAEVYSAAGRGHIKEAIEFSEEVLELAEAEQLTAHMGGFYEAPAVLYYHLGAIQKAERYLRLAIRDVERYGPPSGSGRMKWQVLTDLLTGIVSQQPGERRP